MKDKVQPPSQTDRPHYTSKSGFGFGECLGKMTFHRFDQVVDCGKKKKKKTDDNHNY